MNNICIKGNSKGLNNFLRVLSCLIVIIGFALITGHYAWPTSIGFQNQKRVFNSDQLRPTATDSLRETNTTDQPRFHEQLAQPIAYLPTPQIQRSPASFLSLTPSPSQPSRAFRKSEVIRDGNGRLVATTTERPIANPRDLGTQPPSYDQLYDYQVGTFNRPQQQQQQLPPLQRQHESIASKAPNNLSFFQTLLSLQNPQLFGGDIIIRTGGQRDGRVYKFGRSALVSAVSLWPNGIIYYEIDPSVAHFKRLIWKVMEQFHNETCIRFVPRLNNEPDFLRFEAQRGCFSYIGRIGGEQTLSLGDGCEYTGAITHEILHAVGFYHHQNRSDRDEFLEILWDNIAKGKEGQFAKMADHENLLLNKFDYNSIMLYGPHTFGKTLDKITMKPKTQGVTLLEIIEKKGLSALDIDSVKKLYKCDPY